MPNHKSAEKRAKQNEKRRLRNRLVMVSMRTFIKKVRRALDNGDVAEAREALPSAIRHLERAAARLLDDAMDYRLTYLEAASPPLADTRLTVFLAEGRDDIEGLERHRSAGLAVERSLSGRDAVQAAVEVQDIRRPGGDALHHDVLLSVGAGRAGLGSVTLVLEMSDDPTQTDDPQTFDVVETDRRRWLGLNVQADLDRSHQLAAFAGRRRGGTACTSGVCYLVPDFRGVEVRLSSRF